MTIGDIQKILDAKIICGNENLGIEIHTACGSDMIDRKSVV